MGFSPCNLSSQTVTILQPLLSISLSEPDKQIFYSYSLLYYFTYFSVLAHRFSLLFQFLPAVTLDWDHPLVFYFVLMALTVLDRCPAPGTCFLPSSHILTCTPIFPTISWPSCLHIPADSCFSRGSCRGGGFATLAGSASG